MCDTERIETVLKTVLRNPIKKSGVPLQTVVRKMLDILKIELISCTESEVKRVIQDCLHSWIIEKTIDNLTSEEAEELDMSILNPVWHLRLVSPEKRQFYQSLRQAKQELIRILYDQDSDPEHIGEMRVSEAAARLKERGLSLEEYMYWVKDIVDEYYLIGDDGKKRFCGIIHEAEKDPEHIRDIDEHLREHAVKEAHLADLDHRHMLEEKRKQKKKGLGTEE